ncbi:MAG: bifunctional non-ous end joining protein LigD [Actinomycetota bacterium]
MPDVEVSHPDRVVFPEIGLTKGELVDYYARVADWILPHLRGRPLTMQIFPKGVGEPGATYIKERRKHFPDWVGSASVPISDATKKKRGDELLMPVIDTADALKYIANQGMVTPHVWLSRADDPSHPDRLVFDLDPSTTDLGIVRDTALELRKLLSADGLVPFVKSTGSRGLHVTVPLDRSADIGEVRAYAEAVAADLAETHPDTLTTEFSKVARGTRLFLDVMRNGRSQTEVAAYGVRGLPTAPVATPLEWSEVKTFEPGKWTVTNVFRRLSRRDDPWTDLDASARTLPSR